jgi:hypothetical protein
VARRRLRDRPLYSDRLVDRSEDEPRYLCSLCAQRATGSRNVREMTDEQRRKLENGAFAFGSFMPGGH